MKCLKVYIEVPDGNHLGYSHTRFLNGITQLHDVLYIINKNLILIKLYLNIQIKGTLSYRLGILLVLWYVEMSWGNLLAIHIETKHTQYFLKGNIPFYDTINENKP